MLEFITGKRSNMTGSKTAFHLWIWIAILNCMAAAEKCSARNNNCPKEYPCCSNYGYCGNTAEYCAPENCIAGCKTKLEKGMMVASHRSDIISDDDDDSYIKNHYDLIHHDKLEKMDEYGVYSHCVKSHYAALTFDDGPHPEYTSKLLKILKEENVKATFFIILNQLSKYKDLDRTVRNPNYKVNRIIVRKMFRDGHDVASHTFDHTPLTQLSEEGIREQMDISAEILRKVIGFYPKFMRPPEGSLDYLMNGLDYVPIYWGANTEDWLYHEKNPNHMVRYINNLPKAKNGDGPIILQHDIIKRTAKDQSEIIQILRKKGYKLVPMRQCLDIRPYRKH